MTSMQKPVLVLGADTLTGLGVARALHVECVPVVGLALHPWSPTCRSSAWRAVLPVPENTAAGWLAALSAAAERFGRMVLIPARDDAVAVVGEHASALGERFDMVMSAPDVVTRLLDKVVFHDWAERAGFPVPRTEVVADAAGLAEALGRASFPVVLKPFERTAAWQAASKRHKVYRLDRAADVERIPFALFDVADRYVLQQWIPGLDSDVLFCLVYRNRDGHELGHQLGRKVIQWPVGTGNTVACETIEDDELHALTGKLFDAAGMVGLGSLEVKRSSADGRFYITEPTIGRPNLQSGLSTAAGTNIALLAYRDACGLPPGPVPSGVRATWVHETTLPKALASAVWTGRLDYRAVAGLLRGGLSRGAAYSARGDMVPLRREIRHQIGRLRRIGRRTSALLKR